jgi:hypothetical protein
VLLAAGDVDQGPIGGVPARRPPGPPAGGGTIPAGANCEANPQGCKGGLGCYTPQYAPPICTHSCASNESCGDVAARACCVLPEGQLLTTICVPAGLDPSCP